MVLSIIYFISFADHPAIIEALDLVEEGDQITHNDLNLEEDFTDEELGSSKNIFHFDPEFEKHEKEYEAIRDEILGNESDAESGTDLQFVITNLLQRKRKKRKKEPLLLQ